MQTPPGVAPTAPIVDPRIEPALAAALVASATEHLGARPLSARVGFSDLRSEGCWSVTALCVSERLVAIAESRVRNGAAEPVVCQVLRRSEVLEVVTCGEQAWLVTSVAPSGYTGLDFEIEGPLMSLPAGTRAHEVL